MPIEGYAFSFPANDPIVIQNAGSSENARWDNKSKEKNNKSSLPSVTIKTADEDGDTMAKKNMQKRGQRSQWN